MIENKNTPVPEGKRQMRNGRLFTNKNKRIKGGDVKNRSINVEEINFQPLNVSVGLAGQISLNRVNETGSAFINLFALGPLGEFTLIGSIIPSVDAGGPGNGSYLGSAGRAYGLISSYQYFTVSDERKKKDIADLSYGLDTVMKLRPVVYRYRNGDDSLHLGFIAQEIAQHAPEVVSGEEATSFGVSYDEVVPILVKAIQELKAEVEELKGRML